MSDAESLGRLLLNRYSVLQAVHTEPREKRALVDALDIPRSTLDSIMRDLEDAGLVTYADQKWWATTGGERALAIHERYLNDLSEVAALQPLLDAKSVNTKIDYEVLEGANINSSENLIPDEVMSVLLDTAATAEDLKLFTPAVMNAYVQPFFDRIAENPDSHNEVIFSPELWDRLSDLHSDYLKGLRAEAAVEIYTANIPVPFGLWIVEGEKMGVLAFWEMSTQVIIENDTPAALDWANQLYADVKESATLVPGETNAS